MTIAPFARLTLVGKLTADRPGRFDCPARVYYHDGAIRRVEFEVCGTAADPGGDLNEPKP